MTEEIKEIWELQDIKKYFPGVKALDGVDLKVFPGKVLGLLGENGSGKSTLIKCLSGVHHPTSGSIVYKGEEVSIHDPDMARKYGIATIFQELSLVQTLTVAENIFLGRLPKKKMRIDWAGMKEQALDILNELKIHLDPDAVVSDLSVAQQQMIEIAKALSLKSELLIMDEPTAALGMEDIENLHGLIRRLTEKGCAVIYISHRMDEIKKIVDQVTVLKDGMLVGNLSSEELDIPRIVRMMIGEDVDEHYPKEFNAQNEIQFEVKDLYTANGVNGVNFDIRKGEVLGLAGVIGSGRTEIAKALFGIDRIKSGGISGMPNPKSPQKAMNDGIALISENRKADGIFGNFTGSKNITISALSKLKKLGILNPKIEDTITDHYIEKLNMPSITKSSSINNLSGGNQQKAIISRWLFSDADLFILDEPTQGIDIGAKVEVYNIINELTKKGKSILLISSDFPELLAMSDRIAVVHQGRVTDVRDARNMDIHGLIESVISKKSNNTVLEGMK